MQPHSALTTGALVSVLAWAPASQPRDVAPPGIPPAERAALVALFAATNGPGWTSKDGWQRQNGELSAPGTECEWEGIYCDENAEHVESIVLVANNLSGTLPRELASLPRLTALSLAHNQLTGPIPPDLFALPGLKHLSLDGNALTGTIPPGGPACRLESLSLADNRLSGPIPESLAECGQLRSVNLSGNALSSGLPERIGELLALEKLTLRGNALEGELPATLNALVRLEVLDLADNAFTGLVFDRVSELKTLKYLDVSNNRFTGPVRGLASMAAIDYLAAAGNTLSGPLPTDLPYPQGLKNLDLSRNELIGPLPESLESLNELRTLDLRSNRLSGGLLRFDRMESLDELILSSNALSDDVRRLRLPDGLERVDLSRNRLHGTLPDDLFAGDELQRVLIAENGIGGPLPASLWQSESLQVLHAAGNQIEDAIPAEIPGLAKLRALNLARNRLRGSIPEALLTLPRLVAIDLSANALAGELPGAGARALQRIDLSDNQIAGTIPAWISALPALRYLGLRGNRFTGGLDALAASRSLRAAALDGNPWRTAVPAKLASLRSTLAPQFPLLDPDLLAVEEVPPPPPPPPPPPEPSDTPERTTIAGTVRDQAGAPLPGVSITAASGALTQSTTTDSSGAFMLLVRPGDYRLTAELAGFAAVTRLVTATLARRARADLIIAAGQAFETVSASAEDEHRKRGPWWNTWSAPRGASESRVRPALRPDTDYTFYFELSSLNRGASGTGVRSATIDESFLERLRDMALVDEVSDRAPTVNVEAIEPTLTFRFMVIGRAARLLESPDNVAVWNDGRWDATGRGGSSAMARLQLAALFPPDGDRAADRYVSPIAARAGGIRFGIRTGQAGCAAVAVSVWDETGRTPLDSSVHFLEVGGERLCERATLVRQATINLLKGPGDRDLHADASLHSFEFGLNGVAMAASFMVLRQPTGDCESYSWSSDATLSGLVLANEGFKNTLKEARLTDGVYATVARLLQTAVFPPQGGRRCGSNAAWSALQALARSGRVTLFARLTDQHGQLQAVPLGLLAMAEADGRALLAHDLAVIEPLSRETLDETSCVRAWTFVLPSTLSGLGAVAVPPWAERDDRVLRSRTEFETRFLGAGDTSDPLGLLLLAHHEQGVLTFANISDSLSFPTFDRQVGDGSIAVLSACETANLVDNGRLINKLNEKGVDALVTSPFVIDASFGARFATNFATSVHEIKQEATLDELFQTALDRTIREMERSKGRERARGMALELVLAGNPRLKVCPRE